jgi:hypothetical protein
LTWMAWFGSVGWSVIHCLVGSSRLLTTIPSHHHLSSSCCLIFFESDATRRGGRGGERGRGREGRQCLADEERGGQEKPFACLRTERDALNVHEMILHTIRQPQRVIHGTDARVLVIFGGDLRLYVDDLPEDVSCGGGLFG